MLGRIAWVAPGIEFLAARAFARDPVGVGAAQAGVLDRFMRVDGDVALRGLLHHLQMMVHHVLAFMPAKAHHAIGAGHTGLAGFVDVAGLHRAHAQLGVHVERGLKLAFVVGGVGAGLVVADQLHALGLAVGADALDVEIGVGLGEAELVAVGHPVAVPALVPAFDQHPAETVLRGEVDVLDGIGRCRAVPGTAAPGGDALVHLPPDAHVLHGLEP